MATKKEINKTKKLLTSILEREPTLGNYGFNVAGDDVEKLFENIEQIHKIVEWLDRVDRIKSNNERAGSYYLKHLAEKDLNYITNGQFIAGALVAGFRAYGRDINCTFNMSQKSLKRIKPNY